MANSIKIITWNAQGIRNKSIELFNFLLEHKIHICLVTETWLKHDISLSHQEYYIYRNDRELGRGGGVAILVRKNVSHSTIPIASTVLIENIGISIHTTNGNVMIYACYFPGGLAGADGIKKKNFATDIYKLSRGERYIIGGDFNSRHQSWGCARANCWGNILYEKQDSYNINILFPNDNTYIPHQSSRQSSTLDLFITNNPELLSSPEVINGLSSDHLPVSVTVKSNHENTNFNYLDFKNANWHRFSQFVNRHLVLPSNNIFTNRESIDLALRHFVCTLNGAISYSVPQKTRRNEGKKLPQNIKLLIRGRNYYRRNWLRYRNIHDYYEYKLLNSAIKWEINIFRNTSWNKLLSSLDKGSSPFWNVTKILRKRFRNIPILKHNNLRFSSTTEKCELLARTFYDNHSYNQNMSDLETENLVRNGINEYNSNSTENDDISITSSRISLIIKYLKRRKSPGEDGINNSVLKALPRKGIAFLTVFINSCLRQGYFPDTFKEAKVIVIRKPNKPPDLPSSYRPISLLSSVSKVLERVVKGKITDFLEVSNILPSQQFGFRREHNTIHPLVRIRNIVKSNFTQQKSTGMILLDIKAAFDTVWHDGLIYKLIQFNFPSSIIKIIQSFLNSRSFRVHIGPESSDSFRVHTGCPQGSCLSPILYNIYTADIPNVDHCIISMFADDTAVLCSGKLSSEILTNLQRAIEVILKYFTKWKIALNCNKSQAIYFTRKRKECFIPQGNIRVNNAEIQWEKNVKYLGVVLDTKLTFKDHISYIVNKCNVLTRTLYPLINKNSALNAGNKMLVFKLIFQAVMFYAAPVWGKSANCHLKRLQILQNKLLKLIYNLPRLYSTARLHQIAHTKLVAVNIDTLSQNFNVKCSNSEYDHIAELVTPLE